MTDHQLCKLLEAFTNYYWSVPAEYVMKKINEWHPEVTAKQIAGVIKKCNDGVYKYHFYLVKDGLVEPEIVTEHLLVVDEDDFDRFIAARIDIPYCDCDEQTLLTIEDHFQDFDIPEVKAILEFGRNELKLDDEFSLQLLNECRLYQPYSLFTGESWVESVLQAEKFGKICFTTIQQVKQFRDLGNQLFQVLPNPVLRGWRPKDVENCPTLIDDIPKKAEDIPDDREIMEKLVRSFGGREKLNDMLTEELPPRPVRRNDPCPCGSGKKYKKCCGANKPS